MIDWRRRSAALAAVGQATELRDGRGLRAVEETPRHVFVPVHHVQRDGRWVAVTDADPGWLDAVYADVPLVTELDRGGDGPSVAVSSSTKPALVVRMLDALDLRDGHRVLEIGTGTGYNAALLCHSLGSDALFTVDVDATLVAAARERLAGLGHAPTAVVVDGRLGLPDAAPFDRIVATCSVPAVPWAWAEQLAVGGLVLVDVKVGVQAGDLVLLRRLPDRLEGRFLPRWAAFMSVRDGGGPPTSSPRPDRTGPATEGRTGHRRAHAARSRPWTALVPWFLANAGRVPVVSFGRSGPGLVTAVLGAADGSWCEVGPPDGDGVRPVRQGGPRRIWDDVEAAHVRWRDERGPGWERLGLTVTADGGQAVWLDDPARVLRAFR